MRSATFDARSEIVAFGACVVTVTGEAGLYAAPALQDAMLRAIADGATAVIVDLTGVTFIDSTTIAVLVAAERKLRPAAGKVVLVARDANVVRVFQITALDRIFPIHGTRAEALDALGMPAASAGR
jgi:anti-sigma B factor antagonist